MEVPANYEAVWQGAAGDRRPYADHSMKNDAPEHLSHQDIAILLALWNDLYQPRRGGEDRLGDDEAAVSRGSSCSSSWRQKAEQLTPAKTNHFKPRPLLTNT